ncbi:Magnesium-chelatase 38 kDa subunit [Sporomusa ovata DSM 2662]|uniref:ChlI component of cobalt chelatase involved in B12 biosynthesis / ChlD component of cobalt chelatase involved in B12 biosynthesis n=1 Tax=Sporomusa ovata TaxID=2378 RepID=A0A0U1L431_9FIRM|nr:VWA domain-containing protein [Sporomusa ovata]EQB25887.1 magnesium-chelatase subunit ChlD [Sporomusa ovata DSM 2662]CQR74462.1 ChlI component of cobalt chelatase involved in B12 biosynthesis / ChlD component of cobalt chelatase involved in B12 biosynthesis [Sporomusa ovata]
MQRMIFPFAAIVGQEAVKRALLIAVVNPKAGGVLVAGEKGTAKSTLVRSLAEIIGETKLIELPLNATEDMVFGGLDMQHAVERGERRFLPGLLARAHNHILYVDEVNLLRHDFLGSLLDAATTGMHQVEREGISCEHEAACTLIGTMNPEEGSLSPRILDRFGLYAAVSREQNEVQRAEIVRRILDCEAQPAKFCQRYAADTEEIKQQVAAAKSLLPDITIAEPMMLLAAQMCAKAHSAGHRAELFLLEAARAIAALAGRIYLLPCDLDEAACYVLPQRMRQEEQPLPPEPSEQDQEQEQPPDNEDSADQQETQPPPPDSRSDQQNQEESEEQTDPPAEQPESEGSDQEKVADIDTDFPFVRMKLSLPQGRQERRGSGKRSLTRTDTKQGRYVRAGIPNGPVTDLAFDATLRAAAPYQKFRTRNKCAIAIEHEDLRQKIREKRIGSTFLFVVDASGSMGARERMRAVKGAVCAMLQDAYQKRDQVGLIAFRRQTAEVLLPITRSVDLAQKCLRHLPTGGKTPLAEGLRAALTVLASHRQKEQEMKSVLVLVTDGRANTAAAGGDGMADALKIASKINMAGVHSVVIDTENDFVKLGLARTVAREMGSTYYSLRDLSENNIMHIVKNLS